MREYFTYGSVRGAADNGGPYRDSHAIMNDSGQCESAPWSTHLRLTAKTRRLRRNAFSSSFAHVGSRTGMSWASSTFIGKLFW
jgi:hypothetical protein